jgi:ankyrin repeat protein
MPPEKNKKGNQGEVADVFGDMLAGFRAADLAHSPPNNVPQRIPDDSPANAARAHISQATILAAIRAGDLTKLRRWHRQGVEWSPDYLCMAAGSGSIAVMRCSVEELGAGVNRANDDGVTPVIEASLNGRSHLVRFLVKAFGADVKKADARGISPLFAAAQNGHLEVVRCLLKELGADDNQASDEVVTPLIMAAQNGRLAVVQYLGRKDCADVNLADHACNTALIVAARNGHLDVVQCLVARIGADVNQPDLEGFTALMMASYGKHDKIVKYLLKHGADAQAFAAPGTAVDASRAAGAPIAQTEYLEAKAHCSNPGCSGTGLKKCTGCEQARYCGQTCQLAHWKAHKSDCKTKKKP